MKALQMTSQDQEDFDYNGLAEVAGDLPEEVKESLRSMILKKNNIEKMMELVNRIDATIRA